jgi:hypothetical protein
MKNEKQWEVLFLGTTFRKTTLYNKLLNWTHQIKDDEAPLGLLYNKKIIHYRKKYIKYNLWGTP